MTHGTNVINKTVLITGANRGIGLALVEEALKRGAKRVYAAARGAFEHPDPRVTSLTLDVTNAAQVQHAVEQVGSLDVLINNAGIAIYDDLSNPDVVEQHFAVNVFGPLKVTNAFLPLLKRSKGAIVNNLSLVALAALPIIPAYSISKAAAFNMTQSFRALLAGEGVSVHGVVLGPIDTDMNRRLEIPKATPESAAAGIFDSLAKGEEEIFPDPASQSIAEGWRNGVAKALEAQFAGFCATVCCHGGLKWKCCQVDGAVKGIDNPRFDFHRQVDAEDPVFASGEASPAWGTAPPPGKHLPAHADQNSSQSRIQRLNCEARDEIEAHRCRVFAEQIRKDNHQAAQRYVPVGETAPHGCERRRA
jgi:NAD(P)-dependent dehydrogenase (short-subunit alcohol dehydrogenase family)